MRVRYLVSVAQDSPGVKTDYLAQLKPECVVQLGKGFDGAIDAATRRNSTAFINDPNGFS